MFICVTFNDVFDLEEFKHFIIIKFVANNDYIYNKISFTEDIEKVFLKIFN